MGCRVCVLLVSVVRLTVGSRWFGCLVDLCMMFAVFEFVVLGFTDCLLTHVC